MTPAQVADARARVAGGATVREVSQALSIPRATIARATKGAWGGLEAERKARAVSSHPAGRLKK